MPHPRWVGIQSAQTIVNQMQLETLQWAGTDQEQTLQPILWHVHLWFNAL